MRHASDPLFRGLVDDAALFPPGNAPMQVALAEHARYRAGPWADAIGPFLCPASRVEELRARLPADATLRLSLVVDVEGDGAHAALRACAADDGLSLAGVEAPLARLGDDASAIGANLVRLPGTVGYLEVPREDVGDALDLVGASGWQAAKYRTGGVTADAFPTEGELAAFLLGCTRRAIPFKLTAGLHHAVRSTSDEGFEQHGLLNVLVATRIAQTGGSAGAVVATLSERRPKQLLGFVQGWDDTVCADVRSAFRSFGCCGVTDPLGDLAALGVLEDAR
jgi:hypothetical protein